MSKHTTLLKKRLWYRCFPVNFEKFLRTPPVAAYVKDAINASFSFLKDVTVVSFNF